MQNREQLVDSLGEEILGEMADSFFGARIAIDDEVELFQKRQAALRLAGQRVLSLMRLINELLIDVRYYESFWKGFGVSAQILDAVRTTDARHYIDIPWAFTRKGRYVKLVKKVYRAVDIAAEVYMNGQEFKLPEKGKHQAVMGWHQYQDWATAINEQIDYVNANQSPSSVLGFARSLDTEGSAQTRVAGGGLDGFLDALDDNLTLKHIDARQVGIGQIPDFPPLKEVQHVLVRVAHEVYAQYPKNVHALLKRLERHTMS